MANFLQEIAKYNPSLMDRNLMGKLFELSPGIFNEEHVRMLADKLPKFKMYQVRPYKMDLQNSFFEPENIIATSAHGAEMQYGRELGKAGTQFDSDELQGPLPRDYTRTMTDEQILDAIYPRYRENVLGKIDTREKAIKDLEAFQKACADGTAEEAWTHPITGDLVYCGRDARQVMDELKYEYNMMKGARKMLPSDEEIMLDPQMYMDTEVSPVRRKASKLINGED